MIGSMTSLDLHNSSRVSPDRAVLGVRGHCPQRNEHGDWLGNESDGGDELGCEVHPAETTGVRGGKHKERERLGITSC